MALIKSNQLVQAGTALVAGDQVMAAPPDEPGAVPPPSGVVVIGGQAPTFEPGAPPSPEAATQSRPGHEGPEGGAILDAVVPEAGPASGFDADPGFPEEVAPLETPPELPPSVLVDQVLEDYDAQREALLAEARAAGDLAFAEALDDAQAQAPLTLEHLREDARQGLAGLEGPEAEAAFAAIDPYLEQVAAGTAEVAAHAVAAPRRWQEGATAEEQVAILLENYSRQVADRDDGAQVVLNLLAERERVLAEARMAADQVLAAAQAQAAQFVADAQARAAQILTDVEARRKEILAELEQQGYAQGYQEGRAQGDEEAEKVMQEALAALNTARSALPEAIRQNQDQLLQLGIDIAEKIVHAELQTRPEIVLDTLQKAVLRVSDTEQVTIKVNPEDLPLVQAQEDRFRDMLKNVRNLDFTSSAKIPRGSVFIETASGTVDATISTQLSVILEAFRNTLAEFGSSAMGTPDPGASA